MTTVFNKPKAHLRPLINLKNCFLQVLCKTHVFLTQWVPKAWQHFSVFFWMRLLWDAFRFRSWMGWERGLGKGLQRGYEQTDRRLWDQTPRVLIREAAAGVGVGGRQDRISLRCSPTKTLRGQEPCFNFCLLAGEGLPAWFLQARQWVRTQDSRVWTGRNLGYSWGGGAGATPSFSVRFSFLPGSSQSTWVTGLSPLRAECAGHRPSLSVGYSPTPAIP